MAFVIMVNAKLRRVFALPGPKLHPASLRFKFSLYNVPIIDIYEAYAAIYAGVVVLMLFNKLLTLLTAAVIDPTSGEVSGFVYIRNSSVVPDA